ncbi:MAG: hypothetical protein V3R94_02360 [Acidobacteriota bacterium]
MTETVLGVFGDYLKKGLAVSIQKSSDAQIAAIVERISPDSIWLRLRSRSIEPVFTEGDEIQINYWDEGATIYNWGGTVAGFQQKSQAVPIQVIPR